MPDQEELKLVVTLDDQASAGLLNLKNQLAALGGGGGASGLGAMGAQAGAAAKGVNALAGEMAGAVAKGTFFGNMATKATMELLKFGKQVYDDSANLKQMSAEINNLTVAASRMGITTTALENNLRGFRAGGLSVEAATKNIAGFNDAIADLSIVNGRLRGNLLSGGFTELPKMFDILNRVDVAKTTKEKMDVIKKASEEIQEYWTKIAGPEQGAKRAREFRSMFNAPDLDQFVARVREVGKVEEKIGKEREQQASRYQKNLADQEVGYHRITAAVNLMVFRLDDAFGISKKTAEFLNSMGESTEKLIKDWDHLADIRSGKVTSQTPVDPKLLTPVPGQAEGMPLPFRSMDGGGGGGWRWQLGFQWLHRQRQ